MRKLTYTSVLLAYVWGLAVVGNAQNCPAILQCPASLQTICDPSENDSTLWNEPLYTWSPLLESADLHEVIADLNMRAVVCHNGGAVAVSYKLLLDLDSDFFSETVVNSNELPPPGIIFANNGQSPGNTDDTLRFDKRNVPSAAKFKFVLDLNTSNDTVYARLRWNTEETPLQYLLPRLPEGRHGILWTVTQDGVTRTCQYSFQITDCAPPVLVCKGSMADDIGPDHILSVAAQDLIEYVGDNITPFADLEISMRESGTGSGFPLENGQPVSALTLDCNHLGDNLLQVWARDRHGNTANCAVNVALADSVFSCSELPMICAHAFWDSSLVIENVETRLTWQDQMGTEWTHTLDSTLQGCNVLDTFPPYPFSITEFCQADPLNGVTTFDLLLISRHVLAIEPLNAPWKIIAADANLSGSVTTNDIVQLRRLILGIIPVLPGSNGTWRFFADNCQFPPNPFEVTICSNSYEFASMPFWAYPEEIRFYGLKVGDVNNSAMVNNLQQTAERSTTLLEMPELFLQKNETIDIPVRLQQAGKWSGFQCNLPFDPQKVEVLGIRAGTAINSQEFAAAQAVPGDVRISWFDTKPGVILPDEALFYVQIRALQSGPLQAAFLPEKHSFASEIYTPGGETTKLEYSFRSSSDAYPGTQVFPPSPNPGSINVRFPLRLRQASTLRVEIGALNGNKVFAEQMQLPEGAHLLEVPASVFPTSGVYTWQVDIDGQSFRGKLVRI